MVLRFEHPHDQEFPDGCVGDNKPRHRDGQQSNGCQTAVQSHKGGLGDDLGDILQEDQVGRQRMHPNSSLL